MIEATIWGTLFYGTALLVERAVGRQSLSGIHLYSFVGHLLAFAEHANKMLSGWSYRGPLSIEVALSGILGVPWLYKGGGIPSQGPVSELDDAFSFSLSTTTEELRERSDGIVMSLLQYILFGMNWAQPASDPATLEALLRAGYKYNFWDEPLTLRR
jgi:hypothetical protein